MKAVILAAGRGSRMKRLTDECPKCLLELNGQPLLKWQIEAIRQAGIEEIGIVTGYKREMLVNCGLFEFHNDDWAKTQMVSSLCCASEWLEQTSCIVSYSDIFYEFYAVQSLMECNAEIAMTYDTSWLQLWEKRFGDPLLDAETFRLNKDGTLAEIGNKPTSLAEIEGQFMGLLKFSPEGWSIFKKIWENLPHEEQLKVQMTEMLQKINSKYKRKIKPIAYKMNWGEIDNENDLKLSAKADL
jgi:choline kinase